MSNLVTDDELAEVYHMAYGADPGNPEDRARRRRLLRPLVNALAAYARDDGTFATFRAGRLEAEAVTRAAHHYVFGQPWKPSRSGEKAP
jgi:hypothetical protein